MTGLSTKEEQNLKQTYSGYTPKPIHTVVPVGLINFSKTVTRNLCTCEDKEDTLDQETIQGTTEKM